MQDIVNIITCRLQLVQLRVNTLKQGKLDPIERDEDDPISRFIRPPARQLELIARRISAKSGDLRKALQITVKSIQTAHASWTNKRQAGQKKKKDAEAEVEAEMDTRNDYEENEAEDEGYEENNFAETQADMTLFHSKDDDNDDDDDDGVMEDDSDGSYNSDGDYYQGSDDDRGIEATQPEFMPNGEEMNGTPGASGLRSPALFNVDMDNVGPVSFGHVTSAMRDMFASPYAEVIKGLPFNCQAVLCAAVAMQNLKNNNAQDMGELTVSRLLKAYKQMCKNTSIPPVRSGEFSDVVQNLSQNSLLDVHQVVNHSFMQATWRVTVPEEDVRSTFVEDMDNALLTRLIEHGEQLIKK
jgi:hypothetical protein